MKSGFGRAQQIILLGIALFTHIPAAHAEDVAKLTERLLQASEVNSLDTPSAKPWHLKLNFHLMDEKGLPGEGGTVEEWWRSPSQYKVVFTSPSYTSTEIHTADGLFRTKGQPSAPYWLALALQQLVHPLDEQALKDGVPEFRKESPGQIPLDCIALTRPMKKVVFASFGLFPTYCFDHDKDSLRVAYSFGTEIALRDSIGLFGTHKVPIDLNIANNAIGVIATHVETLRSATVSDADFVPTAEMEKADAIRATSGTMQGQILTSVTPKYPARARQNRTTGAVEIYARIGTDGKIHAMKLVSVPDSDLAIAAINAVRQWIYKPYLLNGAPVEVETTITVNFNMGS